MIIDTRADTSILRYTLFWYRRKASDPRTEAEDKPRYKEGAKMLAALLRTRAAMTKHKKTLDYLAEH